MKDLSSTIDFEAGYVLPIDKPYGWTSADVVRKVKNLLKRRGLKKIKVGHAGTLDPLATGILVVCIGKATKQAETLQNQQKRYLAEIRLGATTPSFDLEHEIDQTYPYEHITSEQIEAAFSEFIGEQEQVPPIYSAKSIDGKRAYEYARAGEEVEMRRAVINIYGIRMLEFKTPFVTVEMDCSKGTYIRSFARDLGLSIQSGGHLTALRRTRSGGINISDCYTMDEVVDVLAINHNSDCSETI